MRTFLLFIALVGLVAKALSQSIESSNVFTLVSQPLSKARAAIEAYRAQGRTNGIWSPDFTTGTTGITNAAGEVGVRLSVCCCTFVPVCYELQATAVSSNSTRLTVGACAAYVDTASDGDEYRERRLRRSRLILKAVMDEIEKQR